MLLVSRSSVSRFFDSISTKNFKLSAIQKSCNDPHVLNEKRVTRNNLLSTIYKLLLPNTPNKKQVTRDNYKNPYFQIRPTSNK